MKIHVTVNGTAHDSEVEPRTLLVHMEGTQPRWRVGHTPTVTADGRAATAGADGVVVLRYSHRTGMA